MGKLLIIAQYVFLIFSSDIHESRKHIHVQVKQGKARKGVPLCKFWIEPTIELAYNHGVSASDITRIKELIGNHLELLNNQLKEFKNGNRVSTIKLPK